MNLVRHLFRSARGLLVFTAFAAALSGACNAGLIALINRTLSEDSPVLATYGFIFAGLALCRLLSTLLTSIVLARFSQENIATLRRNLVRRILSVPLRRFEEVGAARLMVVLTEDVMNIAQALLAIPSFAVNLAILASGGLYLAWLSPSLLGVTCGGIVAGGLGYRILVRQGFLCLARAREEEDRLFGFFRALTEGLKELKLHRERRGAFLSGRVQAATAAYQRHNVDAEVRFAAAHAWNHLLLLAIIGLILFALPLMHPFSPRALTGYVVTMLYLMGPLAGVMSSIAVFGRASAALAKVEALGLALGPEPMEARVPGAAAPGFQNIKLVGVTHSYSHEKDDSNFILGPLTLEFQPGELVFLAGGNGSGKTSLAKLVTGLYPPESGEIRLDGRSVTDANRDDYRQLFSAVFFDFHLFEDLLGLGGSGLDGRAAEYLAQLHLDHKVRIREGRLSTTALSQGQRKRLALLTAYLEDRPFYVFDEWAADQDPLFKELFYTQLLPELKARGKAVLVISHDETYYPMADRLIELDYGQLRSNRRPAERVADAVLQN